MTRRPWLALSLLVILVAGSTAALLLVRDREQSATSRPTGMRADGLTLLIVRAPGGPYGAVVGSTGDEDAALVLPSGISLTVPGQGEATMAEALGLPPRQAATAAANLLGVWIDHYAVLGRDLLVEIVDGSGGIAVGDRTLDGEGTLALLREADEGRTTAFSLIVSGLLRDDVDWQTTALGDSDSPGSVLRTLEASGGATVSSIPVVEAATGIPRADPDAVRRAVVDAFGGPDRDVVGVIVLNGSGVPGIGELVAERIVPQGFRVVISDNASNFDHEETLVVVGSADDVVLGERVRDLLGTGSVNVSVASGIAPVTVVVGKDFEG